MTMAELSQASETAEYRAYLRSQRTLSESEVAKRTVAHDADSYTAAERSSFTQEV